MMIKLMFLPMMLKVLTKTHRPYVCALLYTLLIITNGLIFDVAFGGTWQSAALEAGKALGGSALYFRLLEELDGADAAYFGVLGLGFIALVAL